jgi:hypothetical protein
MSTCGKRGRYRIYSDRQRKARWREGRCWLPKGHVLALVYHEVYGIRLERPAAPHEDSDGRREQTDSAFAAEEATWD